MTLGRASALTASLIGAMALGIVIAPYVTDQSRTATVAPGAVERPATTAPEAPAPKARVRSARKATPTPARIEPAAAEQHLKPLLNRGADMKMASSGFRDAEQFATIAHAARNTEIPFVLLKHRVLTEGKTLAAAIEELKPELDSVVEADLARTEAKADMAKLRG